jgi:hypothetical protein
MLVVRPTEQPHHYIVGYKGGRNHEDMQEVINFINEIATWCKVTFGNEYETWDIGPTGADFSFTNTNHEMLFKLRWVK